LFLGRIVLSSNRINTGHGGTNVHEILLIFYFSQVSPSPIPPRRTPRESE